MKGWIRITYQMMRDPATSLLLHSDNNERLDPDSYQMMQDPATSLLLHSYNNDRLDPDHVSNDAASLLLCTLLQYR